MAITVNQRLRGGSARGENGAALVEFALVLPILLMLLLGMLEFGRAMNYWIDTTHLANVAARWAAVGKNPGDGATLCDSIREQADTDELRSGDTTSVPAPVSVGLSFPDGTDVGDPVRADVSVEYVWLPFLGDAIELVSTTLTGSATMRLERDAAESGIGC
jgi:hypothetical protein